MWKITHIGQRRTRKTKRKIPNITTVSKGEDNLTLLRRYCGKLHIVFLPQVLNFEAELVRYTDVKKCCWIDAEQKHPEFQDRLLQVESKGLPGYAGEAQAEHQTALDNESSGNILVCSREQRLDKSEVGS